MKGIKISDEAWDYLLNMKAVLKNSKSMGELASQAILNNVKGELE